MSPWALRSSRLCSSSRLETDRAALASLLSALGMVRESLRLRDPAEMSPAAPEEAPAGYISSEVSIGAELDVC